MPLLNRPERISRICRPGYYTVLSNSTYTMWTSCVSETGLLAAATKSAYTLSLLMMLSRGSSALYDAQSISLFSAMSVEEIQA